MKALTKAGVKPILIGAIEPTIIQFASIASIPFPDLTVVGSTGKKEMSNDIDVAIDINKYPFDKTCERLIEIFPWGHHLNRGAKIGSFAVPDDGWTVDQVPPIDLVQLDLMFSSNIEWAKFIYYSPNPTESHYKGAIRTILLSAIASNHHETYKDAYVYQGDVLMGCVRRAIDFTTGLKRKIEIRRTKKDGTPLKTMKTATFNEFHEKFPLVRVADHVDAIDDPDEVVKTLFGCDVNVDDINTAEKLIGIINGWQTRDIIYQRAAERLKGITEKVGRIPPEVEYYFS